MLAVDSTIGPYRLVRPLGRGGFGEVWLAERKSSLLTTRVALKLPILDEGAVELIRHEAQVWLQASGHPNIVPVLDAEVYDGQVVIASEYIAGGTLTAWLVKHGGAAPSIEAATAKASAILSGLDFLHRADLIHRDLKPDNVLLQDGAPRLTDFGLARFAQTVGLDESVSGTPRYMAPETFSGTFSPASDLWSVGVILYEMLAGCLPFQQKDIIELLSAVQSREQAPLSAAVPERLRSVVARLLSKSPSDRYVSAADALTDITATPAVSISIAASSIAGSVTATKHNLPTQTTSFIGRQREQSEIRALLGKSPLLTLTGSGGCGKTRLALQVAYDSLDEFVDGVRIAELAALTDGDLVAQSVAGALGISEARGQSILQTIVAGLQSQSLLLLLDNCEHVISECGKLVDAIIRGCPAVRILATSREPLNISGEQTYRVPSLALPERGVTATREIVNRYESVRLFVERANASSPDFEVTDENAEALVAVCRRLDGIPLAIELAAARTRSLSLNQISSKLDDRFRLLTGGSRSALPRQQTLRSLIDWSYSLLTAPERTLLRRLSVFSGGWSLEAAERVCSDETIFRSSNESASLSSVSSFGFPSSTDIEAEISPFRTGAGGVEPIPTAPIEEWEILDLLTALGDKSLLVSERLGRETRYRLLETVRQYASDRVEETDEGTHLHDAHRDYFLGLAERAEEHYTRPTQGEWLARLDQEHDNFRAALDWCDLEEEEGAEPALRLSGALWRFWHTFGYIREGREQLVRALARTDDGMRTIYRAKALNGCALLSWYQGDSEIASDLYEKSVAIGRELGDKQSIAASLIGLGLVLLDVNELESASELFTETWALCAEIGDQWGLGMSLNNLGLIAMACGDLRKAGDYHEESLQVRRTMEDQWGVAMSLNNLGSIRSQRGDFATARELQSEALTIRKAIRDKAGIAYSLEGLAALAAREDRPERASALLGAAEALRETIGAAMTPSTRADHETVLAELEAQPGSRPYESDWQRGRVMTLDEALEFALSE